MKQRKDLNKVVVQLCLQLLRMIVIQNISSLTHGKYYSQVLLWTSGSWETCLLKRILCWFQTEAKICIKSLIHFANLIWIYVILVLAESNVYSCVSYLYCFCNSYDLHLSSSIIYLTRKSISWDILLFPITRHISGAFLRIIIQDEEETNDQRISWITILSEQERLALCVRRFLSIVGIFSGFQLC